MLYRSVAFAVALLAAVGGVAPRAAQAAQAGKPPKVDPGQAPVAQWVWGLGGPRDNQSVWLRGSFDSGIPEGKAAKSAVLFATADNQVEVLVNGKQVGSSGAWEQPARIDVTKAIVPGRNVVVMAAKNEGGIAAALLKLQVELEDGKKVYFVTDKSWRTATEVAGDWWAREFDDSSWKPAAVLGAYGMAPWGLVGAGAVAGGGGQSTPAESLTLLPGFNAELLYSVPKATEGSWVSMTPDPKGRLYVSDQGGPLYRVTVGKAAEETKVEKVDLPIGHAQGLLWAFDSLYVVVNGGGIGGHGSGLYRLRDTDNNDQLDKIETLKKFNGAGEHGPHAVRVGPDGKSLYLVAGNFTQLPEPLAPTSPHRNWAEDQLLPRNPDGGGHDPHIMAPGGWICRTDPDGKTWEVFCAGLRNAYDIDFNGDGELFTYDSDMEWDTGSPWYRPTRVNLAVSGGEYGWRNGTGKWPEYYPDSLGAVVNTGLGSPTGVAFGKGAKFPAKYQQAFFINDWSYGFVYAVHLTPAGAGYKATFEPFVQGKPFNVTDVVINTDGAMYVTIGGRGTQSGLYRISYNGAGPTTPAAETKDEAAAEARALRHKLESFHGKADPQAVEFAWEHLNSSDRYIRYAARVAVEWQPVASWQEKALSEKRPTAATNALVALSRYGDKALQPKVVEALNGLPLEAVTEEQLLEAMRAYGLCFIRMGKPDAAVAQAALARLDPLYPTQSIPLNRELVQVLTYLDSPSVVAKTMPLLAAARTQEEQLHFVLVLRNTGRGWTMDGRKAYFSWLAHAEQNYRGGNSFKRFLMRIREDALKTLSPQEKGEIEPFLKAGQRVNVVQDSTPRQFVKNWQMADLLPVIDNSTKGRNFEKGRAAYAAVQCAACHRFGTEGGGTGPDLTGVGNRFSPTDTLEAIIHPSKVISDQYATTEIVTKDRNVYSGFMEAEDADTLTLRPNPLAANTVKVAKKDVAQKRLSKVSPMPEGLVDYLNQDEILDLIAYMRSAGNPDDKAFKP